MEWDLEVASVVGGIGLVAGFIAEIVWQGNMLWMTAGGILGGFAGGACDTALFLYRRHRRSLPTPRSLHPPVAPILGRSSLMSRQSSVEHIPQADRLNRVRYALYAPIYDLVAGIFAGQRKTAISALRLQAGQRVLLVGCGTGLDLDFVPAGVAVTGLDLTPGMVTRAEERARRRGLGGAFVVGDARSLPFSAASFDVVILHLILAVAPEPERIVAEVDRVLVPGGTVSIFDKFLPAGQTPGLARRLANRVAALAFSELNRTVEPLVAGRGWRVRSDEPAGFRGSYRRIIAIKPVPVSK